MCVHMYVLSRIRLYDPMDCSPQGSSVHEIFQAGTLEWVAISYSNICIYTTKIYSKMLEQDYYY